MPLAHVSSTAAPGCVYDVDPAASQRVLSEHPNAVVATTPAEVAAHSHVVIMMLPDGEAVRAAVLGDDGLITALRPGSLVLDTTSSQPWLTTGTGAALAAISVDMVDAAVSGAQWGAQAADLVFMIGVQPESVERVRPILEVLGRSIFHVGALGSGHVMKSINKVVSRTFDDPFRLALMVKDIGIASTLARNDDVSMPLISLGEQLYQAAANSADPGASLSEIARWVEQRMGTEVR